MTAARLYHSWNEMFGVMFQRLLLLLYSFSALWCLFKLAKNCIVGMAQIVSAQYDAMVMVAWADGSEAQTKPFEFVFYLSLCTIVC